MRFSLLPFVAPMLLAGLSSAIAGPNVRVLDPGLHHLGVPGNPEWQEMDQYQPGSPRLDLKFEAESNPAEMSLFVRQRGVKFPWTVELNGQSIGKLEAVEFELIRGFAVPAGKLRQGLNTLSIVPPAGLNDILISEIKLESAPLKSVLTQAKVKVNVKERSGAVPCRITIADPNGGLAALSCEPEPGLAIRTGVVYSKNGQATIGLAPGTYDLFAGRGFEYSVAAKRITVQEGDSIEVDLEIQREVPTEGWIAADSHIHTLSFSGHGDATVDERMITIAGEGIELAISTDHNRNASYAEGIERTKTTELFSWVIGNEVTTKVGHFNAFPIGAESPVVDPNLGSWPLLMEAMRTTPKVEVVTLNHPRDTHSNFSPFESKNFNAISGGQREALERGFDAMEVVTSGSLQSDFMLLYRDWFALLNHGSRIAAVGSSDSHDVNRYILGQGRTYVACDDRKGGNTLPLEQIWKSYREGRLLVSLGLWAQIKVNGGAGPGDLATGLPESVPVELTVLGPSWVEADHVALYANGVLVREEPIANSGGKIEKAHLNWKIPRPKHDVFLVAIASGPGVSAPYWPIPHPYQPTSKVFNPKVIGSTNPVWLDADGDGQFQAARVYAQRLVEKLGVEPTKLFAVLADYDEAVAAQTASICLSAGVNLRTIDLSPAPESTKRGFAAFLETLRGFSAGAPSWF